MSTGRKRLPAGDDRALFVLSRGRCYAPGCAVAAFQKVEGHYTAQLRQAHIYAHSPGGPRYNPAMTQEQRDSWTNIILLCDGHHGRVDSQANVAEYPAVLLLQWKEEREEGRIGDLPELQGISDLDLQQLLLRQVEGVLGSIERLEGVSQAVIDELKGIVEHQFIDPKLDLDAMAEFSFAVRSLRGMAFSEDVTLLHRATDDLKRIGLEDQASLLIRASKDLKHLNDLDAFALRQVRNDLDDSFSRFSAGLRELSQGTDSLKEANDQAALNLAAGPQHYWMDDIRRFWPFISRAFLVGAAVGGTAVAALAVWISKGANPQVLASPRRSTSTSSTRSTNTLVTDLSRPPR